MDAHTMQQLFHSTNTNTLMSDIIPVEKDLKVDKKILDIMKSGGNESHPALTDFIQKIQKEAGVHIGLSTSLRDRQGNEVPVLKVRAVSQKNIDVASALIMERLDPHRDKMSFNIDVPFNDHSYIIGKDGSRIKYLSRTTGCHIHLPDCNKTSSKKSNKLSIAGTDFTSIDRARDQIRKSLPLNIGFKAQIKSGKFVIVDTASAEVQAVKRKYHVDVTFTNVISNSKYPEVTINVKGGRSQLEEIESATRKLYHYVTDEELTERSNVVFTITIDISHSHHQFVKGKNNCNLKVITYRSGANIMFPPNDPPSNQVVIHSHSIFSTVMGWQELMGYLPLLLSFDVNFDINEFTSKLNRIEKEFGVGIRIREKLAGHVYTILVKTQERHSTYLQEIRQKIMDFKRLTVPEPLPVNGFGATATRRHLNHLQHSNLVLPGNDEKSILASEITKEIPTFRSVEAARHVPIQEHDVNNNHQTLNDSALFSSLGSNNFNEDDQLSALFRTSATTNASFHNRYTGNYGGLFGSNDANVGSVSNTTAVTNAATNALFAAASTETLASTYFLTNGCPFSFGSKLSDLGLQEKISAAAVASKYPNITLPFSDFCFRCEAENPRSKSLFPRF